MTVRRPSLFRVVYTVDTWMHQRRGRGMPRRVQNVVCGLLDWSVGAPPIQPRWWKWERDVIQRDKAGNPLWVPAQPIDPDKIVISDHCRDRMRKR